MPAFASIGCAVILSAAAFGQAQEHPPAFEAADVHVSAPARNVFMRGPRIHGSLYDLLTATMLDLISKAYGLNENEILGGPSWLEMDRFDVVAKLPPKSTRRRPSRCFKPYWLSASSWCSTRTINRCRHSR